MWKTKIILFLSLIILGAVGLKITSFFQPKKVQTEVAGVKISETKIPTLAPTLTPTSTATSSPTFTPSPTATPSPTLEPTPTATPSPTLAPIIILSQDLDILFTKYSDLYGVDKELLKRIANCESGLNPNAATSLYVGLFQFAEPIWIQTRNLLGLNPDVNLRFNPEEAIRTAAFMVSQGHLGIWPICGK